MTRHLVLFFFVLVVSQIPLAASAQEVAISIDGNDAFSTRAVQLFVLVTLLSLVPGLAITVTCFPFIVTVLSILRQALGLQQSPPNMLIVSLALFLTYYVMEPVFIASWQAGVEPYSAGAIELLRASCSVARSRCLAVGNG